MLRTPSLLLLLLTAQAGCGRSMSQIRAQASAELLCPPERIALADRSGWRWHVKGCNEEVLYECYGTYEPCRRGDLARLAAEDAQRASMPGYQPQPYQQPGPSSPGYMGIVQPGSYNPRTGAMQHSYTNQYSSPPPPAPVYRPPAYTPSYTPSYRR